MTDELLTRAEEHTHRVVRTAQVREKVHGVGRYGQWNKWLALKITGFVGSMTCAYLFGALALISLPAVVRERNVMLTVNWVAQTFLQLVLLSIIIVGQRVLSEADDARADADHETLDLLHQMNILQLKILRELEKGAEAEAEAASKLKSKTTSTNRNR